MEKVFSFNSPKEHYAADACILWCFDDRFSPLLDAFIKERAFAHADVVESAGGAKALAGEGADRDFVLNQIGLSVTLHATPLVVLMLHMDCGGYGGSKNFHDDAAVETQHHKDELIRAAKTVAGRFPQVAIEAYIADFDGLYRVS